MSNFLNFFKSDKSITSDPSNTNNEITPTKINNPICIIGGLQYIGAHIVITFLRNNYNVIVLDTIYNTNFVNYTIFNTYSNFEFMNIDYNNLESIINILIYRKVDTIIYPFRNSFSFKDSFTIYSNTINPLINILKIVNSINLKYPKQITKFICASNSSYCWNTSEILHYNNTYYVENSNSFFTFMKEKLIYDFHQTNSDIQIYILRLSSPCGCDPLFYNSLLNINYLKYHKSLQSNIIFSLLTGSYLQITKHKSLSPTNASFINNINFLDIQDIANAFLLSYKTNTLSRFEVLNVTHYKTINMCNILKQFGTNIRFYLNYSNIIRNNIKDFIQFVNDTKEIINWDPIYNPLNSFSYINNFLSNKLKSIDLTKLEDSNNTSWPQTMVTTTIELNPGNNLSKIESEDDFDLFFDSIPDTEYHQSNNE